MPEWRRSGKKFESEWRWLWFRGKIRYWDSDGPPINISHKRHYIFSVRIWALSILLLLFALSREHLHLELIASRVKDACWEALDGQRGQSICGMKAAGMEVGALAAMEG